MQWGIDVNPRPGGTGKMASIVWPVLLVLMFACSGNAAEEYVIRDGGFEGVMVGDPMEKILSTLGSKYTFKEGRGAGRTIDMYAGETRVATFHVFLVAGISSVGLIDVYGRWKTAQGIDSGATLAQAIGAYGRPVLEPTDEGYYARFDSPKEMLFLLDDEDIPEQLRGIPDDVFLPEHEEKILSLAKDIGISRIRIYRRIGPSHLR